MKSMEDLQTLVVSGFDNWTEYPGVTVKTYPDNDLILFNYNIHAVINNYWPWFERVSRGLILNRHTGEVVARPFDKFWNWHETCPIPKPNRRKRNILNVYEKMDGSMGVLYRYNGEYGIATRGSLTSDQAFWATEFFREQYGKWVVEPIPDEYTLIFEIIYPENRIVVDYGEKKSLTLLAIRNRHTGAYLPWDEVEAFNEDWGFYFDLPMTFDSMRDNANIWGITQISGHVGHWDSNKEGVVVEFDNGTRWKIKGAEYCRVHKILSTISFKNILAAVVDGTIDDVLELIPEHFLEEVNAMVREIRETVLTTHSCVSSYFSMAPKDGTRKEYAQWVMQYCPDLSNYMFAMMDGKDITPMILKYEFKDRSNKHLIGDV